MATTGKICNFFILVFAILSVCPQSEGQTNSFNQGLNHGQDSSRLESYIVVLKRDRIGNGNPTQIFASREGLIKNIVTEISEIYSLPRAQQVFSIAVPGAVMNLNPEQVANLARDPRVAYIEKDQIVQVSALQTNATWGLDRIDQPNLPLDNKYNYINSGVPVNAYIIDTGILTTHPDFQGKASHGYDFIDKDSDSTDCNGHGTHVAGTIGSATYGVSKNVKLFGVRVLDCFGTGTYSSVIAGVEWVTANHIKPAVVNMSLGGPISKALDEAVAVSIQAGVTYVVAAGNSNQSACESSPARIDAAISVGSTTKTDTRSDFSNYGPCVDLFAPGSDIKSLWHTPSNETNTISGTSMATPHVTGVAALYLSKHPNASPIELKNAILAGGLLGKISNVGNDSPNLLLNTQFLGVDGTPPGGGDDKRPNVPELKNGDVITNLSGAKNNKKYFSVKIPANSRNLKITISGGSGDVDLYTKFEVTPTLSSYDCRPYRSGNSETCTVSAPKVGQVHIMLRGYLAFSGVTLRVTHH